eukprot:SAG31_NODE_28506_length_409_cov_0.851613_1_plen_107_part_01
MDQAVANQEHIADRDRLHQTVQSIMEKYDALVREAVSVAEMSKDTPKRSGTPQTISIDDEFVDELASPFHLQLPEVRELDWGTTLRSPSRSLSVTPTSITGDPLEFD